MRANPDFASLRPPAVRRFSPHHSPSEAGRAAKIESDEEQPTDSELIDLYRSGDSSGMEMLFTRHRGAVMAVARRHLGVVPEADDILQESFARLTNLAMTQGSLVSPRRLLLRIAANLCRDRHRSLQRHLAESLECCTNTLLVSPVDPEAVYLWTERNRRLFANLAQLKPLHREILELRVLERLSHTEIAAKLGISRRAVENHYSRVLQRLRATAGAIDD